MDGCSPVNFLGVFCFLPDSGQRRQRPRFWSNNHREAWASGWLPHPSLCPPALLLLCFVRSAPSSGDTGPAALGASLLPNSLLPREGGLPLGSVLSWKAELWPVVEGLYSPFSGLACFGRTGHASRPSAALQGAGR